jgi:hypothetical protein
LSPSNKEKVILSNKQKVKHKIGARKNQIKSPQARRLSSFSSSTSVTSENFFSTPEKSNWNKASDYSPTEEITEPPTEVLIDGTSDLQLFPINNSRADVQDDDTFQSLHYGDVFPEWVQDVVGDKIRPRRRLNTSIEYMNVKDDEDISL